MPDIIPIRTGEWSDGPIYCTAGRSGDATPRFSLKSHLPIIPFRRTYRVQQTAFCPMAYPGITRKTVAVETGASFFPSFQLSGDHDLSARYGDLSVPRFEAAILYNNVVVT